MNYHSTKGETVAAKDKVHDLVVEILDREGWKLISEQHLLRYEKRKLFVDLLVENKQQAVSLLVEVKSHSEESDVEFLTKLLGKYQLYSIVLEANKISIPLYIALPLSTYNGILSEPLGRLVLDRTQMPLIVFDFERKVIVLWKH